MTEIVFVEHPSDSNAAAEDALRELEEEEVASGKRLRGEEAKCPACKRIYETDLPFGAPGATLIQKEQHVTGICSDKCWDKFVGAVEKEEADIQEKRSKKETQELDAQEEEVEQEGVLQ